MKLFNTLVNDLNFPSDIAPLIIDYLTISEEQGKKTHYGHVVEMIKFLNQLHPMGLDFTYLRDIRDYYRDFGYDFADEED
jgi:hypothetical protein